MQQFRKIFHFRSTHFTALLVFAWLALGVAPCAAVEPVETHDCPHCESAERAEPNECEVPRDALTTPAPSMDDEAEAIDAGAFGMRRMTANARLEIPDPRVFPPERPPHLRYCRRLE